MPSQDQIDADPGLIEPTVIDNYSGPIRFLQMFAPMIEERGHGTVVGVASVAGDRGRLGNYVYGSTKSRVCDLPEWPQEPADALRRPTSLL